MFLDIHRKKKNLCLLDSELFSVACNKSLLLFLLAWSSTSQEIATVPRLASTRDREKNLGNPLLLQWFLQAFAHIFCSCKFNFLARTWKKIYLYSLEVGIIFTFSRTECYYFVACNFWSVGQMVVPCPQCPNSFLYSSVFIPSPLPFTEF